MTHPQLEIQDVYKNFGNNAIHKGISFNVTKGERVGLLGSSGTGKSVLLRSIIGLEHLTSGKIYFDGQRIDNIDEHNLVPIRNKISYSFQSGALFDSMSVFENIAFPLFEHTNLSIEAITTKVNALLKEIDLEGKNDLMPSDLSGGMQKRVGMARSMVLGPDIMLYDEPTAGLDPSNTVNVIKVMKKFSQSGLTSIFVSHDIFAVKEFCERIIILEAGRVVFDDNIEAFNNSKNPSVSKFLITEGFKNVR